MYCHTFIVTLQAFVIVNIATCIAVLAHVGVERERHTCVCVTGMFYLFVCLFRFVSQRFPLSLTHFTSSVQPDHYNLLQGNHLLCNVIV